MAARNRTGKALQADVRQARLAAQLRSNLKKRKQQTRARSAAPPGESEETGEDGNSDPAETTG